LLTVSSKLLKLARVDVPVGKVAGAFRGAIAGASREDDGSAGRAGASAEASVAGSSQEPRAYRTRHSADRAAPQEGVALSPQPRRPGIPSRLLSRHDECGMEPLALADAHRKPQSRRTLAPLPAVG